MSLSKSRLNCLPALDSSGDEVVSFVIENETDDRICDAKCVILLTFHVDFAGHDRRMRGTMRHQMRKGGVRGR